MASRKLTFDAPKPSARNLGASPAARATIYATSQNHGITSPERALATPTRPAQRATLARLQQTRRSMVGLASPGQQTPMHHPTATLGRRNPLQAITEKEKQRGNQRAHSPATPDAATTLGLPTPQAKAPTPAQLNDSAAAAAVAIAEQQRVQKARVAEWVFAYRRAFPSFVFYFEGIDDGTAQRLTAPIRNLGASVETFFSAQKVTHVIVESAEIANDTSPDSGSHVVSLAKRFQLKIWDLEKLEKRVLAILVPGYNAANAHGGASVMSAKRKLNEAFSTEKMYAMRHKTFEGTSVAHCVDFYYFKYYYVLVEDATHLNRPAIVEDYRPPEPGRDPPWPKLYMVPTGRCPFLQYEDPTTSSKGSDSDVDDNKENVTPEPEATLPTVQLMSKTPASRLQTPHRKAWTPTAQNAANEPGQCAVKPLAIIQGGRARADATREAADYLLTPTRPSRVMANGLGPPKAIRPMDASLMMDSNASGIAHSHGTTSTSTAFHPSAADPTLQQGLLQNLNNGRVTHLSKLEQPVASPRVAGASNSVRRSGRVPPTPRTVKPRAAVRRPVVAMPGYCENCHSKYDDMIEHIKTPQHRRFATNERNWIELDSLLTRVQRPVLKQQPAHMDGSRHRALYALSSDDACMSAPTTVSSAAPGPTNPAEISVLASAPAALVSNWTGRLFAGRQFGPSYPSPRMLASGRFSTEATDRTTMASGPSMPATTGTPTTACAVDLSFPDSNSPCASHVGDLSVDYAALPDETEMGPKTGSTVHSADMPITPVPRRGIAASTSIESLVSSLETPRFSNDSLKGQYDDGATLFADGADRLRQQQAALLETPTRPGNQSALNVIGKDSVGARYNAVVSRTRPPSSSFDACSPTAIGGATLVQPPRVKPQFGAAFDENTAPGDKYESTDEHRLSHALHGHAQQM
ncbi:Cdc7p-Dbf4p kinase complex regulatory subunit [Coemansia sp. RSA 2050]|nr:Cdc7p-Dbf4p kinase complex regulatory subunit [Coemansia sp. RSA 2050]KAJ2735010.1 Cdc7p-Dbf4p kinase complex regulatory subunit [Coemansia sp. BCRC 34962]